MSDVVVNDALTIPDAEIDVSFARAGGPGGQHVNKTETKVELRWKPAESAVLGEADRAWLLERLEGALTKDGELIVTSAATRDQARNRSDAELKLASVVAAALERPKKRKKTRPSKGAKERRLKQKKQRAEIKKARKPPQE